jgi:hypothetical protein
MIKLAAFWKKTSKEGRGYYVGKLGDGKLLLFQNKDKKSENHPDLQLFIVQDTGKKERETRNQAEPEGEEDIPF